MSEWLQFFKGVFLLDQATYDAQYARPNPMKRGIYALVISFLVASFGLFILTLVDSVTPFTAAEAATFRTQFLSGFEQMQQFMPQDDDFQSQFIQQFTESFDNGLNIAIGIDALPRRLPFAAGGFLTSLGFWLSQPLVHLTSFLGFGIWILLFSKWFGGRGDARRFFGLTALYAVPNMLGLFSPVPFVGRALVLLGVVWGWVIYVRGMQVSQGFSAGKSIAVILVALLTFFVFFITLIMVVSILFGVAIAQAS